MIRTSRFVFLAAITVVAMVASVRPVGAQEINTLRATPESSFLVADMANSAAAGQQASSGYQRHEGVGIGVKFGPLFSSFSQAKSNFKSNTGFEGGIFFGGNRPGVVGVMGEILYAQKGSKSGTSDTKLSYLEIPILLRINAGSSSLSGVSVYGLAGPVFDILLKGEQNNLNVKSNYESLDLGMLFGVGVEITRFLVEGRYNVGLKNVLKGSGASTTDIKSRSFAILLGVRLN